MIKLSGCETYIFVQKYWTIDAIVSIGPTFSQIENKLKSEKHVKILFVSARTNPTLGISSNIWDGCVWTVLDVPDIMWGYSERSN